MKNSYKPYRIIDGYYMKKQLHGGFKLVEVSHFSNETFYRKRTLKKNLNLNEAEDMVYRLESKLKK